MATGIIEIKGTKQREETFGLIAQTWVNAEVNTHIIITQPNDKGGKSLEKNLKAHFPEATSESRDKSRIITLIKTEDTPAIIAEWLQHTELRLIDETGFYSMPGLFGWNRIDVGSAMLIDCLPDLKGTGADFGCGYGYLARHILTANPKIQKLYCLDYDNRAVAACRKNITDDRAECLQADCTRPVPDLVPLDFIVMNPPFHDSASEDHGIGQNFIITAAKHLKSGGKLYMVANRHLPYEKILAAHFKKFEIIQDTKGFKIIMAMK